MTVPVLVSRRVAVIFAIVILGFGISVSLVSVYRDPIDARLYYLNLEVENNLPFGGVVHDAVGHFYASDLLVAQAWLTEKDVSVPAKSTTTFMVSVELLISEAEVEDLEGSIDYDVTVVFSSGFLQNFRHRITGTLAVETFRSYLT